MFKLLLILSPLAMGSFEEARAALSRLKEIDRDSVGELNAFVATQPRFSEAAIALDKFRTDLPLLAQSPPRAVWVAAEIWNTCRIRNYVFTRAFDVLTEILEGEVSEVSLRWPRLPIVNPMLHALGDLEDPVKAAVGSPEITRFLRLLNSETELMKTLGSPYLESPQEEIASQLVIKLRKLLLLVEQAEWDKVTAESVFNKNIEQIEDEELETLRPVDSWQLNWLRQQRTQLAQKMSNGASEQEVAMLQAGVKFYSEIAIRTWLKGSEADVDEDLVVFFNGKSVFMRRRPGYFTHVQDEHKDIGLRLDRYTPLRTCAAFTSENVEPIWKDKTRVVLEIQRYLTASASFEHAAHFLISGAQMDVRPMMVSASHEYVTALDQLARVITEPSALKLITILQDYAYLRVPRTAEIEQLTTEAKSSLQRVLYTTLQMRSMAMLRRDNAIDFLGKIKRDGQLRSVAPLFLDPELRKEEAKVFTSGGSRQSARQLKHWLSNHIVTINSRLNVVLVSKTVESVRPETVRQPKAKEPKKKQAAAPKAAASVSAPAASVSATAASVSDPAEQIDIQFGSPLDDVSEMTSVSDIETGNGSTDVPSLSEGLAAIFGTSVENKLSHLLKRDDDTASVVTESESVTSSSPTSRGQSEDRGIDRKDYRGDEVESLELVISELNEIEQAQRAAQGASDESPEARARRELLVSLGLEDAQGWKVALSPSKRRAVLKGASISETLARNSSRKQQTKPSIQTSLNPLESLKEQDEKVDTIVTEDADADVEVSSSAAAEEEVPKGPREPTNRWYTWDQRKGEMLTIAEPSTPIPSDSRTLNIDKICAILEYRYQRKERKIKIAAEKPKKRLWFLKSEDLRSNRPPQLSDFDDESNSEITKKLRDLDKAQKDFEESSDEEDDDA